MRTFHVNNLPANPTPAIAAALRMALGLQRTPLVLRGGDGFSATVISVNSVDFEKLLTAAAANEVTVFDVPVQLTAAALDPLEQLSAEQLLAEATAAGMVGAAALHQATMLSMLQATGKNAQMALLEVLRGGKGGPAEPPAGGNTVGRRRSSLSTSSPSPSWPTCCRTTSTTTC